MSLALSESIAIYGFFLIAKDTTTFYLLLAAAALAMLFFRPRKEELLDLAERMRNSLPNTDHDPRPADHQRRNRG